MCACASASRSAVVMPGRASSRARASVSWTTSPAARISSSWAGDLTSTRERPNTGRSASAVLELVEDPVGDRVDLSHAVDLHEQPAVPVDRDQRLGLLGVHLLAAPDDLLGVVRTALHVSALQQPRDELLLVHGERDDRVELDPEVGEHFVELVD